MVSSYFVLATSSASTVPWYAPPQIPLLLLGCYVGTLLFVHATFPKSSIIKVLRVSNWLVYLLFIGNCILSVLLYWLASLAFNFLEYIQNNQNFKILIQSLTAFVFGVGISSSKINQKQAQDEINNIGGFEFQSLQLFQKVTEPLIELLGSIFYEPIRTKISIEIVEYNTSRNERYKQKLEKKHPEHLNQTKFLRELIQTFITDPECSSIQEDIQKKYDIINSNSPTCPIEQVRDDLLLLLIDMYNNNDEKINRILFR